MAQTPLRQGTSPAPDIPAEWEMGLHQRGLVDACWEEGQFGAAILILDQFRSSKVKPSIIHIQQLLYISLFDPTSSILPETEKFGMEPMSPRKYIKRTTFTITPTIVADAHRLLMSFAITNTPQAIARALPSYDVAECLPPDDTESALAQEAFCITQAKNCWELLEDGFTKRRRPTLQSEKGPKGKRRRANSHFEADPDFHSPHRLEVRDVVGESAWPVLGWLLLLFERDEEVTGSSEPDRHSPLLIKQVPPPRGTTGTRWDTELPLAIIFFCLDQQDPQRQDMGSRLLALLINISHTNNLDTAMFVAAVQRRLSSSSYERFLRFFSLLGSSAPILRFKIALCQKMIGTSLVGPQASITAPLLGSPRAQPRVVRKPRQQNTAPSQSITSTAQPPTSLLSKDSSLRAREVLSTLETNNQALLPSPANSSIYKLKFELLSSFGLLQTLDNPDKDPDWPMLLQSGEVKKSLRVAFSGVSSEENDYRETLSWLIDTWQEYTVLS